MLVRLRDRVTDNARLRGEPLCVDVRLCVTGGCWWFGTHREVNAVSDTIGLMMS